MAADDALIVSTFSFVKFSPWLQGVWLHLHAAVSESSEVGGSRF
jgi:hypothetical protein